jgi:hypothetical protein
MLSVLSISLAINLNECYGPFDNVITKWIILYNLYNEEFRNVAQNSLNYFLNPIIQPAVNTMFVMYLSCPNLGPETGCPDSGFLCLSSVPP